MEEMWKANCIKPKTTDGMHTEEALAETLAGVTEEQIESGFDSCEITSDAAACHTNDDIDVNKVEVKSFNHEDFLRGDKGDAKLKEGDEGYDEEMGGASQLVQMACEAVGDSMLGSSGHTMNGDHIEAALLSNIKKSVGLETMSSRSTSKTLKEFARMREFHEKTDTNHTGDSELVTEDVANGVGLKSDATMLITSKSTKPSTNIQICSTRSNIKGNSGKFLYERTTTNFKDSRACNQLSLRGAKESIPAFSSRRMLYAPSYLREKK
jgi:hypothetical protein